MTFEGRIKNGQIELDSPVDAPDGTLVVVHLVKIGDDVDGRESAGIASCKRLPDPDNFTFEDLKGLLRGIEQSDDPRVKAILEKHS